MPLSSLQVGGERSKALGLKCSPAKFNGARKIRAAATMYSVVVGCLDPNLNQIFTNSTKSEEVKRLVFA